jgi:chromosome partitioning protein
MSFNASLGIPIVAILRDTQNYVHAAEQGLGIYEMPRHKVKKDIAQLSGVVDWLGTWRERRRDSASSQVKQLRDIHVGDALPAAG